MTTDFDTTDDFLPEPQEAVFIVAFTDNEGPLIMEAVGDIDDLEYRVAIVIGLRGLADTIEGQGHDHAH